jgi:hypothetical protein
VRIGNPSEQLYAGEIGVLEDNIKDHGLLLGTQAIPGWAWMPSILKASLLLSGSPAVAVVLGYSKLCQNLALGAWG